MFNRNSVKVPAAGLEEWTLKLITREIIAVISGIGR
jgi:hypothetical protein